MKITEVDILLVEDSQEDCELALRALRRERLANNIFIVRDGEQALNFLFCTGAYADRAPEDPPKLVLLDLKLPKINGMEVLKQVKSDSRTRHIPVVVMTSSKESATWPRVITWARAATSKNPWTLISSAK
jgi:CheY-like chemotaxis protein